MQGASRFAVVCVIAITIKLEVSLKPNVKIWWNGSELSKFISVIKCVDLAAYFLWKRLVILGNLISQPFCATVYRHEKAGELRSNCVMALALGTPGVFSDNKFRWIGPRVRTSLRRKRFEHILSNHYGKTDEKHFSSHSSSAWEPFTSSFVSKNWKFICVISGHHW